MAQRKLNPNLWIDKYADYLFNYSISRVNDTVIAEDLVQETFLSALKALKQFKGDSNERTWLTSILKRKIIDHYRKTNSAKGKAEVKMDNYKNATEEGKWLEENIEDTSYKNSEMLFENEDLRMALLNCMEKLPKKHAELFKQKTILNMDTKTICKEHNITASNLWVIIHRSRMQLIECLNKEWFNRN